MAIYISKLLAQLIYPVISSLLLAIAAGLAFWRRRRRLGGWCLALSIIWLWLCATPLVARWSLARLETRFPPVAAAALPEADAILVLGGIVAPPRPPHRLHFNLSSSVDRLWHAARLFKAGKAPRVVAVGGNLPWSDDNISEAYVMAEVMQSLGVPPAAILIESASMTTYENALYSKKVLAEHGIESILLVTSAMHMPRALATYRGAGIKAMPAPIDFIAIPGTGLDIWDFLPDVSALGVTTAVLRETMGGYYYRLRGWIR